jgi:hypothetical protein
MKVKKAIELLEKGYPNTILEMHSRNCRRVVAVSTNKEGNAVCLEDYSDETKHFVYNAIPIAEIVKELKVFNPEAELKFHNENGPAVIFLYNFGPNGMLAVGEYDTCMQSEIGIMLYDELRNDEDRTLLDVYKDLLDYGIDVEMMRKYRGDKDAELMERFCKENGLI